jgi:hypothetical protein
MVEMKEQCLVDLLVHMMAELMADKKAPMMVD